MVDEKQKQKTSSQAIKEPPDSEGEDEDVLMVFIVDEHVKCEPESQIEESCRKAAVKAADDGTLNQNGEGQLVFANPGGSTWLSRFDEITSSQKRMEDNIALLKHQVKSYETDIALLKHQVKSLSAGNKHYRDVRKRFLSVYKRDKIGSDSLTEDDRRIIRAGNAEAYDGNCIVDAELYLEGYRTDEFVFRELYGVGPTTVRSLCTISEDIIRVLDTYATIRSAKGNERGGSLGPFYDTFDQLKDLLERIDKDGISNALSTKGTPLSNLYWLYWSIYDKVEKD